MVPDINHVEYRCTAPDHSLKLLVSRGFTIASGFIGNTLSLEGLPREACLYQNSLFYLFGSSVTGIIAPSE